MKFGAAICVALMLSAASALVFEGTPDTIPRDGKRLVELSNGERRWVSHEEVTELVRTGAEFVSVVESQKELLWKLNEDPLPDAPSHQDLVKELAGQISEDNLAAHITAMSDVFTRYYAGDYANEGTDYVYSVLEGIAASTDLEVNMEVVESSYHAPQYSIIFRFVGENPAAVIVGSHVDSINMYDHNDRSPGADDDASGTALNLEAVRLIAAKGIKPNYNLEFHFYAAEEVGLVGSQVIAQAYAEKDMPVHAMLEMDMAGYIENGHEVIGINEHSPQYTDPDLTEFNRALCREYLPDIDLVEMDCGYGCSDHASWTSIGARASNVFETDFRGWPPPNEGIHTIDDTIDNISISHVRNLGALAIAFAVELAF